MQLKQRGVRLALGALIFAGALACRTSDIFVAQNPTATATRTQRPTFTPLPQVTNTAVPVPTNPPPPTSAPTKAAVATARPTARPPTARPPTKAPVAPPTQPPAQPPPPPPPQFEFDAVTHECVHAGQQYIKGRVYDSISTDAGGLPGVRVAMGAADGSTIWQKIRNEDDGYYTFILTLEGHQAKAGTYYVWLIDGTDKRISDLGGPVKMNPVGPDVAGTCWNGWVDFRKR